MSSKVGAAHRHDSALKHVTGQALYIDDMPVSPGTLHAALVLSPVACGRLRKLDLSAAAASPGVVAVLAAGDVPGKNDVAPVGQGEPLFAVDRVEHAGQPLALVVAESLDAARHAAEHAVIEIDEEEPILDIATALAKKAYVQAPATLQRGDVEAALARAPHRLTGAFSVGGQEHFYLEGQIALALPGEDGDLVVHSSTQHPTEVQHICARLLGCDFNRITAVVRRLGGGFGGKESNASWVAGAAALAAVAELGRRHRPLPFELAAHLFDVGLLLAVEFGQPGFAGARCGAGHAPAQQGLRGERQQRRFVRPEFEQAASALAAPGEAIEVGAVVVSEPREERQIVRPCQHVHRIDLQQPQPIDGAFHVAEVGCSIRTGAGEALGGKGDAARRCGRELFTGTGHGGILEWLAPDWNSYGVTALSARSSMKSASKPAPRSDQWTPLSEKRSCLLPL